MAKAHITCSTQDCERPTRGRGLCGKHYQRAVKDGALPETWAGNRADLERMSVTCPCGTDIRVTAKAAGRKRYCSQACKYKYRVRPSGLTYTIVAENPAWMKPGNVPHNALTANTYRGVHQWIRTKYQKTGICENCGRIGKTEWANIEGEYRQVREDWAEWCPPCHRRHDHARGARAELRFGEGCFR